MSWREKLSSSVKKGGLSNDELHHPSRAYERYFEGWREDPEPVPGRRRFRAVRTYVADLYVQALPDSRRLRLRVLFVLLFLLALPPFVFSAVRDVAANTRWYVTLPQAAAVFTLAWMGLGLIRYCTAPKEMTTRQYREAVRHFHLANGLAALSLGIGSVSYLAHWFFRPDQRQGALLGALLCLFSCGCVLAVFLLERTVPYMERDNPLAK